MMRRISRRRGCWLVVALVLAWARPALAREEYTRTFDKTIAVKPGGKIYVEHKLGDVVIRAGRQPEVTIHAAISVSARDATAAKQFADRVEILVEPSATELTIRTKYPSAPDSFFGARNISYTVHYEITVPESAPLEVRNAFGGVSVTGVKASSEITSSHGDVEWRDGRGTQQLGTSFAGVRVSNNTGDVAVESSNGNVEAMDVAGALSVRDRFANVTVSRVSKGVAVSNSNGSVNVSDSGGLGTIKNSFGNVTVQRFRGDLTVNNSNGRVEAANVEGAAELNTTFGEVRFTDIGKRLTIRANNSRISGERVDGALTVENSFGAVTVSDVQSGLTIHSGNGEVSIEKIRGDANVKTSFGTVRAQDVSGVLQVQNTNGAVKAMNTRGADVTTSFASVNLDGVAGPLRIVNQNGSVDAGSAPKGGCQPIAIRTSFATVRVRLGGEASYKVAARTSFGAIHTDFPLNVSGSISNDSLNGVIGGGRCDMTLTNNNGAIDIVKGGA